MKKNRILALIIAAVMLLGILPLSALAQNDKLQQEIDHYNYVIGTNAFSPSYQFTEADPMMELSDAILAWGSNMIKFNARDDMDLVDRILEGRDFEYVFMWFRSSGAFGDGYSEEEARADYDAVYAFTKKLLQTYNGTGKEFFLGHWEGDWYYLDGYNGSKETVDDVETQGMIAWLNNRQQAVDDAKRDTPHEDVYVWNYLELNRPVDAMEKGYDRVVNCVLPFVNVDYVSYSAYDSKGKSARDVKKVIDYIYENLPEKSGVPGSRVFIGEVAEAASACDYDDNLHCETNLNILAKYLRCDVRFVLYWQMYCNEETEDGGNKGFWLIDSDGNKTQLYQKLQEMFEDGKAYVASFAEKNGRVPTEEEYRDYLLQHKNLRGAYTGIRVDFAKIVKWFRSLFDKLRSLFGLTTVGQ